MPNTLISYQFGEQPVRIVERDGDPWFVAGDVKAVLGYRDAFEMCKMLDEDEKGTDIVRTLGGDQEQIIISESGLYAAILKSRRPEAKRFRKWVTSEVLPSIRKTGAYTIDEYPVPLPPPIVAQHDTQRLIANVSTVREARRLYGPAAARRVWSELGLPVGILPQGEDDHGFADAVARFVGDATEVMVNDVSAAIGISHPDRNMIHRIKDVLRELGFAEYRVKRRGRCLYAWQRRPEEA